MKAVIFAGGVGTRLWPLSRKKSPKQFEHVVGNKSTLQLSVDLLLPEYDLKDIYIATGKEYVDLVRKQLPELPPENVIGEPSRRDVGPAVAFWMAYLSKIAPDEPVTILWSDHLMRKADKFKQILAAVNSYLTQDPHKIIYFGHKPRFASENLGWIETGTVDKTIEGIGFRNFLAFRYRPNKELAQQYFGSGRHCWNLGSFATTPKFLLSMFEKFSPEIYELVTKIVDTVGTPEFEETFEKYYNQMPQVHLDNAISEKIEAKYASVIVEDIGWSDVGAWEALKEALEQKREDNITKGRVMIDEGSVDNLVYNYDNNKLIVAIDIEDLLVVNTDDVLMVAKKTSVPKIKKLVESFEGTEHESLT